MTKIYYPYPANDGKHKYYIIAKSGKTIKFGAAGYSNFLPGMTGTYQQV
jgi:hypothetical protein